MDRTEQSAIRQFIAGLGQPLSDKVYSAEPKDLEACISKAVFEEANPSLKSSRLGEVLILATPGAQNTPRPTLVCRYCKKAGHSLENCETRARIHGRMSVPQPATITTSPPAPVRPPAAEASRRTQAHLSGRPGNSQRNQDDFQTRLRERNPTRTASSDVTCYRCQGKSHYSRDCATPTNAGRGRMRRPSTETVPQRGFGPQPLMSVRVDPPLRNPRNESENSWTPRNKPPNENGVAQWQ